MANSSNTPRAGTNLNIGSQAISLARFSATLALGIAGTLFYQGNLVSTREYTTAINVRTVSAQVFSQTGSTATGGLKSALANGTGIGNYNAILVPSPFSATAAASNGVNAGTGRLVDVQIEVVAATIANTITCSIANNTVRGTGGVIVIPRTSIGTGAVVIRSTGSFLVAPTESFRCSLGVKPSAAMNIKVLQEYKGTRLVD